MFAYLWMFIAGAFGSLLSLPTIIVYIILGYKLYKNYKSDRKLIDRHVEILLVIILVIMIIGGFWGVHIAQTKYPEIF